MRALVGLREPIGREDDAGGAGGNGLFGDVGLAAAGEGGGRGGPPAELGRQLRGCFLPGGDGGESVAERERLDADGAGEGDEGLVDGQAACPRLGLMVVWVDFKRRLTSEIYQPAVVLPARLRRDAPPLKDPQNGLGPEVLMDVDRAHGEAL